MNKAVLLFLCLTFTGCAHSTPPNNIYPANKTNADWLMDSKFCQISAGQKRGPLGLVLPGNLLNLKQSNEEYDACLRRHGWME